MVSRFSDVYKDWLDTRDTPEIRIRGRVLEKFGFTFGTPLMISIEQSKIVITPIPDDLDIDC